MSDAKKAPPTIYDVAALSGLSIATVSRVLNTYSPLAPAADKEKTVEGPGKGQES